EQAAAKPDHKVVLVVATDGIPDDSCIAPTDGGMTNSLANAVSLVGTAANSEPKLPVFVIGVGSELTALNQISQAGGTGDALLVDTAQNIEAAFTNALHTIRKTALTCEYPI